MEDDTVDGWNPANQLRLVTYPIIYKVLAPSKRWLFGISEPSTVSRHFSEILIIWQERIVEEVGRGQVSKIMLSISGENVPRHSQTLVVDGRGWYYSVMRFSNKPLIRISGAFLKYDFDHHHFSDVFFRLVDVAVAETPLLHDAGDVPWLSLKPRHSMMMSLWAPWRMRFKALPKNPYGTRTCCL